MRQENINTIYLAGGCFWGTERFFSLVNGVVETKVGYANGNKSDTNYKEVCTGDYGFAEVVEVAYDRSIISLELIMDLFFKTIDPTSLNRQAEDQGVQYRTGVYSRDNETLDKVKDIILQKQNDYDKPIVTEVLPLNNFILAEDYHQDYLVKNESGYCHIDISLFEMAKRVNR